MTTEAVAIVTPPEKMTESERRKFNDLDGIIRKGLQTFAEVGASLRIIRDQGLYREEYDSFEAYCQDRCGWTRQRAAQLIGASEVVTELSTMVDTDDLNERQARALLDVPPEHRAEVLTEAQAEAKAEGKPVTAKRIKATGSKHTTPKQKPVPKSMAEQVADATARRTKEAEESDRRIAEARAKREAPEPEPVPNAEPVVVDAETEPTEDVPVEIILDFIRGQAIEPPTLTPEDVARAAAALTEDDVRRIREMKKLCLDLMTAYARRGLQVA